MNPKYLDLFIYAGCGIVCFIIWNIFEFREQKSRGEACFSLKLKDIIAMFGISLLFWPIVIFCTICTALDNGGEICLIKFKNNNGP